MKNIFCQRISIISFTLILLISCTNSSGRRDGSSTDDSSGPIAGVATHIKIETAAGGLGVEVIATALPNGSPVTLYAVSRDAFGNFVADTAVNWSESTLLGYFSQLTGNSTVYTPTGDEGVTVISATHTLLTADFTGDLTISYDVESITGLSLWLRADSFLGQLADDDNVISWSDRNGSSRSVLSLGAGQEPTYKTNIANGWPVIRFDSTNSDGMQSTFPISDIITDNEYTYFIVFNVSTINTDSTNAWENNALLIDKSGVFGATLRSGTPIVQSYHWDGTTAEATKDISLTTNYLFTSYHEAGSIFAQLNGDATSTDLAGTTTSLDGVLTVGGGYVPAGFYNGDIAEIIIYNNSLSTADRTTVQSYLCNKYNLTCP